MNSVPSFPLAAGICASASAHRTARESYHKTKRVVIGKRAKKHQNRPSELSALAENHRTPRYPETDGERMILALIRLSHVDVVIDFLSGLGVCNELRALTQEPNKNILVALYK